MKAILIDDEKHTRMLLRKMIDWRALGIDILLEAVDGESAASMIESDHPEIIITDMKMPARDGVSLLQWLQGQRYAKKIIVISGYTEFHYMQKTIEYGGLDYLTKPVDEEKLTVVLHKAVKLLKAEKEERRKTLQNEIRVKEITPIYLSHVMTELIENQDTYRKSLSKLHRVLELNQSREPAGHTAAMITFVPESRCVRERFGGDADLVYFAVLNIVNEILSLPDEGLAFRYLTRPGRIISLVGKGVHDTMLWRRVREQIGRLLKIETEIYIGPDIYALDGMRDAYLALEDLYENRNLLAPDRNPVHTKEDGAGTAWFPLMDREGGLMMALRSANTAAIKKHVDLLLRQCEDAGMLRRKQIRAWEAELDWIGKKSAGQPPVAAVELAWWDPSGRFSMECLRDGLCRELLRTAELLQDRHDAGRSVAAEVRNYIDEHYSGPISVKSLARTFHLNPEHLSRLFKQKYDISIKDYLMTTRIAKAGMLLESGKLKINEVASLVGFGDEKYFSKVFRKYTSMSPIEYRKSRG